jgi:hypothetical protein
MLNKATSVLSPARLKFEIRGKSSPGEKVRILSIAIIDSSGIHDMWFLSQYLVPEIIVLMFM